MARILLVEDESDIATVLADDVRMEGHDVEIASDGETALRLARNQSWDLLLLDVMLPRRDGFEVCRALRRASVLTPIIMLTARAQEAEKVLGLEIGADDYITKPFDSEVLLLKIKAILKRNEEINKEAENKEFDLSSYHFNPKLRQLSHNGITQTLSPKENELLKMLAEHLNDLLPREQALKKIWGSDTYFNGRSMDVYIAKLRKYLKDDPKIEIVNIHGNGFRLVVQ